MTFLNLQTRIAEQLGLDLNDSDTATKIKAWINEVYKHICGLENWPWLIKHDTLQTAADITTGTVSVNAGSTALTFSSGPTPSVANDWMIQFADSDDWYDISAHTAGETTATLADAYNADDNLSGGTYTLRRVYYSLPDDCDGVLNIRQFRSPVAIEPVSMIDKMVHLPDPTATGRPYLFHVEGLDSSNNWRLVFYPTPDDKMNLHVTYLREITELSANDDEPIVPERWHNAIVFGALGLYGGSYIDDERIKEWRSAYGDIVEDMLKKVSPVPSRIPTKRPFDSVVRYFKNLRFPDTFENR